jgi:hypothetical protein
VTHESFDSINRVLRIRDCLTLREQAHQAIAILPDRHDRRRSSTALNILDNLRLPALDYRYRTICRTQIYTNYFTHMFLLKA